MWAQHQRLRPVTTTATATAEAPPYPHTLKEYLDISDEQLAEALPRLEQAMRKEAEEYPALAQTSSELLAAVRRGGIKSLSLEDQIYLLDYYYKPLPLRKW